MCWFGRKEKQAKFNRTRVPLPDGFIHLGYDEATRVDTYLDTNADDVYWGAPGARYGDRKGATKRSPFPLHDMPKGPPPGAVRPGKDVRRCGGWNNPSTTLPTDYHNHPQAQSPGYSWGGRDRAANRQTWAGPRDHKPNW